MKQWVQKLIDQFGFEVNSHSNGSAEKEISDDRATLLFIIDTYNKHLVEIDTQSIRQVRKDLDEYAMQLLNAKNEVLQKTLFRFRQFFSSYRLAEYTYMLKTFDDFRSIIWDFVDQLGDEFSDDSAEDDALQEHLSELREAVEANSIDELKNQSRQFIDSYIEFQTKKDVRRKSRLKNLDKNLEIVKRKLVEANLNMSRDHLTSAFNRKSFDEKMSEHWKLHKLAKKPVTLLMLDIDHFKKVNDTYGHAIGDFVLIELVKLLNSLYSRDNDFVARVGGEEFAIIMPDYKISNAIIKAEHALSTIANEVFIQDRNEIRFTCSMGIAQLIPGESVDQWMKRADEALYSSKSNGRNQFTVAPSGIKSDSAA